MNYQKIDEYVLQLVENSTPERTAWNLEKIREGKPASWNYIDGCMLTALMEMDRLTGDERYARFVRSCADHFVQEDGSIRTFKPEAHNLDDINEGRVLFDLYGRTGKEKYRKAADFLHRRLEQQPRTVEGSFWHKAIYPNQVWLDGIYMAQPFSALYEKHFGSGDYSDPAGQIRTVRARMFSQEKGLYYHGYDASRAAFWADPVTGCSKNFWLRSLGWFAVALADLLEILPQCGDRADLGGICLVAGLGPEDNRRRDGSYGYYISEPVVENDAKGVAPFVLAYTEIKRLKNHV